MESALNLFCPACGAEFTWPLGCCGCCLRAAVQLQSGRFGAELPCAKCGRSYVVLRVDVSRGTQAFRQRWSDIDDLPDTSREGDAPAEPL
jgi:hypothetical protein